MIKQVLRGGNKRYKLIVVFGISVEGARRRSQIAISTRNTISPVLHLACQVRGGNIQLGVYCIDIIDAEAHQRGDTKRGLRSAI